MGGLSQQTTPVRRSIVILTLNVDPKPRSVVDPTVKWSVVFYIAFLHYTHSHCFVFELNEYTLKVPHRLAFGEGRIVEECLMFVSRKGTASQMAFLIFYMMIPLTFYIAGNNGVVRLWITNGLDSGHRAIRNYWLVRVVLAN